MKILFNLPPAHLKGGPVTHLPSLRRGLERQCDIIPYHYGAYQENESTIRKVFSRARNLSEVQSLIRHHKPDIVHCNSAFDPRAILRDAPLATLTNFMKTPLFIKVHGSLPEAFTTTSSLIKALRKQLVQKTSAFGVLSLREKEEFEEYFPEVQDKVFVVKNIIKDDFFSVIRKESDIPTVLFISRFIQKKGMFDLLRAVPHILSEVPSTQFLFIGDGPDSEAFDKEVILKKLTNNVVRKPHISNEETRQYYQSAWVFAFPTHFPEGMPMVIAETMAAGVPCVTTRTRFSQSYMTEGIHCYYTEYGSEQSIAENVVYYLQNKQAREQASRANKELAYSFTQEPVTNEFLALYSLLCSRI